MDLGDASHSSSSSSSSPVVATPDPFAPERKRRPRSVSRKNEELLLSQNSELAMEYLYDDDDEDGGGGGAWAHESAIPEVGGLVVRMPLEAEMYRGIDGAGPSSALRDRLFSFLDSDEYGGGGGASDDYSPSSTTARATSPMSSAIAGGMAAAATEASSSSTDVVGTDVDDDREDEADDDDPPALAARTTYWYRGAERLLRQELGIIMSSANPDGRLDPTSLGPVSLDLLGRYMDHTNSWQEVCLVIDIDERLGSCTTLTINRPMAFKLSRNLAGLVLFGSDHAEKRGGGGGRGGGETQNLVKFLSAFEGECGVYLGGTDDVDRPATMIHGIRDLRGAVEISPGTGIYMGGLEAAMDGVLSGKYRPLDFRFFLGRKTYVGGRLDEAVRSGKYQPVACSRPLVLKQCIKLPKPLWHEGMESHALSNHIFRSLDRLMEPSHDVYLRCHCNRRRS